MCRARSPHRRNSATSRLGFSGESVTPIGGSMNQQFNDKGEIRCPFCPHFDSDAKTCAWRMAGHNCPTRETMEVVA